MKKNRKKQFTLIELIIVIVVIGILAGMALPKFIGVEKDAKVASLQSDLDVLDKAVMLYNSNSDDNSYPLTNKIEKDTLKKTLIDTLAKLDDDGTEIYNLDESKLSPYVSRLKYDMNDYAYSTKSNNVVYKPGKINSKNNIYHLNKSYLTNDGENSTNNKTKPTITLTPDTIDFTNKVVITINASSEYGIKSIELPDGSIIENTTTTTYEVMKNGEFTFKVKDINDNETVESINIKNIITTFSKMYGGEGSDGSYSIQQTSDGGYILCGDTYGGGDFDSSAGSTDTVIIKLNINGIVEWSKTYGGTDIDKLYSIQQTSDGGYIACGWSYGSEFFGDSKGGFDTILVKFDNKGNKIWSKVYGGPMPDLVQSIQETSDGGYVAVGYTYGSGDFGISKYIYSTLIIKFKSNGEMDWSKVYGGSGEDQLYSVQQTSDGGYIACGSTKGGGDFATSKGSSDTLLIKYDSNGEKEWSTIYGGSNTDVLYSVQQINDGGYIAVGSTKGGGDFDVSKGGADTLLIKYDSNGNKVWSQMYGGSKDDVLSSIQQTSDGGYIACGYTNGDGDFDTSKGGFDTLLIKYDSNGNKVWSQMYGGSSGDRLFSVQQTSDGGYIATGWTNGGGDFDVSKGSSDTLIMKYDKDGNIK